MTRRPFFDVVYQGAMLIFPRAFRARFGDEMLDFARARMDSARRRGRRATLIEGARLLGDVAATLPDAWTSLKAERRNTVSPTLAPYPRDNMDILFQDLRFALRSLMRRPGFTAVAAVTLALGIGANTAIFSIVDAVLIRALPYDNPNQLAFIWGSQGTQKGQGVSYADYVDWRARNHTFVEMGALRAQSVNLTGGDAPDRLIGSFVSASLFRALGTKMSQGRPFADAETEIATKTPVAIVQYEAWRSRFGADPALDRQVDRRQRYDVHRRRHHGAEYADAARRAGRVSADAVLPEREWVESRRARRGVGRTHEARHHDRSRAARSLRRCATARAGIPGDECRERRGRSVAQGAHRRPRT